MRYRFGDFELDDGAYTLTRGAVPIPLQPKMFELLRYLIEQRERVVSKDELLDTLWPGEHVNQSAVTWTVSHVRNALGQGRGDKQPIETIHGRGYRFTAPIERSAGAPPPAERAPAPAPPPPSSTPPTGRPFVGRATIMRRLDALLRDASAGHGRLCLLQGEAGIGKTRCAEALLHSAYQSGLGAYAGRAAYGAGAPVFWPWIQILRELVRAQPDQAGAGEEALSRLVAYDQPEHETEGADRRVLAGRFWLMEAVTRFLLQAASVRPMVLLIDDLQWADAGTLDLLAFLASELPGSRVLVIATLRTGEGQASDERLARCARHAERIELTRLGTDDIGRYIAEVCGVAEAPPALAEAVHRATAGNPLFVQETVRALVSEHGGNALLEFTPAHVKPPEVARDVLRARLASLPPETRALLAAASVLGDEFELSLLQSVSKLPLAELLKLTDTALAEGLLIAESPQRRRFAHALLRQVFYEDMDAAERVATHRAAAIALEELRTPEPHHSEIAHHYYCSLPAGGYAQVAAAAQRAAAAAEVVFAYEDAVRFYTWALEAQALDPNASPRARAELLFATGTAQRGAGRDGDARKTLTRMFELGRTHGFADLLLRGARRLRPTFAMSTVADPVVRDALEDALRLTPEDAIDQRVLALSQLACVPPYAHDMDRSKELSGQALELARRSPRFMLEALRARLFSLSGPDDIQALLAVADEMLALSGERPTVGALEAQCARAGALIYRGEIAAADKAFEAVGHGAAQLKLPEMLWYYERQQTQRHLLDGRFLAAEAGCRELQASGERMGLSYAGPFVGTLRRVLTISQHGLGAAPLAVDLGVLSSGSSALHPTIRAWLTRMAADYGRRDAARVGLEGLAVNGFGKIPKDIAYLNVLANAAQAATILEDQERAEELYGLLTPYAKFNTPDGMLLYQGPVSRFLGMLASCLDRDEEASEHWEEALLMTQRMGQRPLLVRMRYEYARQLSGRKDSAAQKRAAELMQSARELARSLNITWIEGR